MKYSIKEVKDFNECTYNGIPKIIHLIWKGCKEPEYLTEQVNSWKRYLDNSWELCIWKDKEIENLKNTATELKEIFNVAEKMPEIASYVDILRLYILYIFGGYYFDADFQIFRDIEPITHVDSDLIICNSTTAYYPYTDNAFLACSKQNSFIKYCLDQLISKFNKGNMENDWIIRRTGPIFIGYSIINYDGFQKTIKAIPSKYMYANEKDDDVIVRIDGKIVFEKVKETFNGRFARHMFKGNGTYEKIENEEKKPEIYLPKQVIKYTKDYNDKFIVGSAYEIGNYTYGHPHVTFYEGELGKVKIGKFCSISNDVTFFVNGYHNIKCVTNYPFSIMIESGSKDFKGFEYSNDNIPKRKDIEIGNDVYIGDGAKIMGGVKIGNGAVIAANSVVCNDVDDYQVVGGNPAKLIKYRFTASQIHDLLKIKWWDWDIEKIKENCKYLTSEDIDGFIERFKK